MDTSKFIAIVGNDLNGALAAIGNVDMRHVYNLNQLQSAQWKGIMLVGAWYLRKDVEELKELCRRQQAGGAFVVSVQPAAI